MEKYVRISPVVIFDMNNINTIVSLAYIRVNSNPLLVFCNLIEYCITISPSGSLRLDELRQNVENKFGLLLPHHLITTCTRILKNDGIIAYLQNGNGYKIINNKFNIERFEEEQTRLKQIESTLISHLAAYVKDFKQHWTVEEAREHFTRFLLRNENATYLFIEADLKENSDNRISPDWYVKKFISMLLTLKDYMYDYLLNVIKGLMVYVGLSQTNDFIVERNQKFRGTSFYLDTKLILRALGYSSAALVEATRELLSLIKDVYCGKIYVFEHNITEVENALSTAAYDMKYQKEVYNHEIRAFRLTHNYTEEDFRTVSRSVRTTIEEVYKFGIEESVAWNETESSKYNLDWNALENHIKARHDWKTGTIQNDIAAINQINILRKADYSIKFGGKNRLPIFITTNYALINDTRDFILKTCGDESGIWNVANLPLISDTILTCRLWLPVNGKNTHIPELALARVVYSAQQADIKFYEKLKSESKKLQDKYKYNVIDLSEEHTAKITEILAKNSGGEYDSIDSEMMANSFEELIKFRLSSTISERDLWEKQYQDNNHLLLAKQRELIAAHSSKFIDKLGIARFWIATSKHFWILSAIMIVILTSTASYFTSSSLFSKFSLLSVFPLIVPYILKILDNFLAGAELSSYVSTIALRKAKKAYEARIKKQLRVGEREYEKEIIDYCFLHSKYFNGKSDIGMQS